MADQGDRPGKELGQLAHELSLLVRNDLELSAAERLPVLRRIAVELAALAGAVVALLLAVVAATWAAVRGLDLLIPAWASPLVLAGAWLLVGLLLLAHDIPRRLFRRLSRERHDQVIAANRAEREQAEQQLRQTADHLAAALLREAEAQGLHAAETVAARGVHAAEHEAGHLLTQLADALLAPGKAGLSIIDHLTRQQDNTE